LFLRINSSKSSTKNIVPRINPSEWARNSDSFQKFSRTKTILEHTRSFPNTWLPNTWFLLFFPHHSLLSFPIRFKPMPHFEHKIVLKKIKKIRIRFLPGARFHLPHPPIRVIRDNFYPTLPIRIIRKFVKFVLRSSTRSNMHKQTYRNWILDTEYLLTDLLTHWLTEYWYTLER
jgi:hypothetical protein